ncbi:MAG: choice-of-anchor Q domain-containing protein, partial [Planctomycetota bacterium]
MANNTADAGGAIFSLAVSAPATVTLENSILADSVGGEDLSTRRSGAIATVNARNSLIESGGGAINGVDVGNITNTDPALGALADNGGLTQTHLPATPSPVIEQGDDSLATAAGLTSDQRGASRFFGTVDIGAVEIQSPVNLVVDTLIDENDGDYTAGDLSLREAIVLAEARPGADVITFAPALTAVGDATLELTTSTANLLERSALTINSAITIEGPTGENGLTIHRPNSAASFRLFHVADTGDLTVRNLTLSGGLAQGGAGQFRINLSGGAGGGGAGMGGGIFNQGAVTLERVTMKDNSAVGGHGAYTLTNVINSRGGRGGGALGGGGGEFGKGVPGQPGVAGGVGGGGGGGGGFAGQPGVGGAGGAGGFGGGGGGGGAFFEGGGPLGAPGAGGFGAGTAIATDGGGGAGMGGAIFNEGTLTVSNSTFGNNSAIGGEGGRDLSPFAGSNKGSGL